MCWLNLWVIADIDFLHFGQKVLNFPLQAPFSWIWFCLHWRFLSSKVWEIYIFSRNSETMIFKGQFSLGVDKYTFFVWLYKQWTIRHSNNCFIWTCKGIFGTCLMQVDFNAILKLEMNVPEVVVISFYSKLVQPIMLLLFVKLTFKSVFVDLLQLCEQWFKSCSFVLVVCPCQTCLQQDWIV